MRWSGHFLGKPRTLTSEVEASEWMLLKMFTVQTGELPEPIVVAHPSLVRADTPAPPPSWLTMQSSLPKQKVPRLGLVLSPGY